MEKISFRASTVDHLLEIDCPSGVYGPSDDSMLLLEALGFESGHSNFDCPKSILELCCGTGLAALMSKRIFPGSRVLACDIDPLAVVCSKKNAELNGLDITVVQSDLFSSFAGQRFDLVLCNPPYLPPDGQTPKDRSNDLHNIDNGVIARFLGSLAVHLNPGARCYLVYSSLNVPDFQVHGFRHVEKLMEKSFFFEKLCLARIKA